MDRAGKNGIEKPKKNIDVTPTVVTPVMAARGRDFLVYFDQCSYFHQMKITKNRGKKNTKKKKRKIMVLLFFFFFPVSLYFFYFFFFAFSFFSFFLLFLIFS